MLNPKIVKDSSGVYWLEWTPDLTGDGYAFVTPGGSSRTFNNALSKTKIGKNLVEPIKATVAVLDVSSRPAELATYPVVAAPPVGLFGSLLAKPFAEIIGTPKQCATWSDLSSALSSGGVIETMVKIPLPNGVHNATVSKPGTYVFGKPGTGITNGRFLVQADYCRLRGMEISGSLYDGVKIADGAGVNVQYVDLDSLWIHDVGDQGVLGGNGTSSDVWVRNCLIEKVGLTPYPGVADGHCVYTGGATRWTIITSLLRPKAFAVQLYDSNRSPVDCVVAGNTCESSELRGLGTSKGTGHKWIGNVSMNGTGGMFEGSGYEAWGNVWWNMQGGYTNGYPMPPGDGGIKSQSVKNVVPVSQYGWLPSRFRDGSLRATADAGC